jgi:hypothetical protein
MRGIHEEVMDLPHMIFIMEDHLNELNVLEFGDQSSWSQAQSLRSWAIVVAIRNCVFKRQVEDATATIREEFPCGNSPGKRFSTLPHFKVASLELRERLAGTYTGSFPQYRLDSCR